MLRKIQAILTFSLLVVIGVIQGCQSKSIEFASSRQLFDLNLMAERINAEFAHVRQSARLFAQFAHDVYANSGRLKNGYTRSKYAMHQDAIYYKPEDDGGSVACVSGFVPIDQRIKDKVLYTEYLDLIMIPLVSTHPEIAQAYFNDADSYGRIYPFFEVLTQIELAADVRTLNFYYLADARHNPERKAVWINEPYVDPAGRGWIISALAPTYLDTVLVGVAGLDITIHTITDRYLSGAENEYLIVDHNGLIIATCEKAAEILQLPPLVDHKYLETIRSDTFRSENFNLFRSSNKAVRALVEQIINAGQTQSVLELEGSHYRVLAAPIAELEWSLWQLSGE